MTGFVGGEGGELGGYNQDRQEAQISPSIVRLGKLETVTWSEKEKMEENSDLCHFCGIGDKQLAIIYGKE